MEQVAFKPVAEGYVYRAPNPWLFGRGRYYRVNENQKAELTVHHRWIMRSTFWTIVIAAGIGGPLAASFIPDHAWMTLAASALVGFAIGFALNLALCIKVNPIVAELAPTSGRITRRDVFKTQVAVMSPRAVLGFAVLDLALFALVVAGALHGPRGWDLTAVVGAVLFGTGMMYFAALYVAKCYLTKSRQARV
jgi:MFS family permease